MNPYADKTIEALKKQAIIDYFSGANMSMDAISLTNITHDLRAILKETPGIAINYKKDNLLNEATGEEIPIEYIESIDISYLISEGDILNGEMPKISNIKIYV